MGIMCQRCFSLNILWYIPSNWDEIVFLCYQLRCPTFWVQSLSAVPTGLVQASWQLLLGAPLLLLCASLTCLSCWSLEGQSSRTHAVFDVVMLCVFCLGQWASRLFQPVQYGQKPEGRTVAFPSTHPPRMPTTNTATAAPQGQVRGRPPIATFSANPDAKGILHNQLSFVEDCGKALGSLFLAYQVF